MKATDSQKFMSALQASVHNVFGLTFDEIKGKTRLGEIATKHSGASARNAPNC